MIRVHHLNNSRSQRVLWLLEELGISYEITRYQRNKATMLAPDERRWFPAATVKSVVAPPMPKPINVRSGRGIGSSSASIPARISTRRCTGLLKHAHPLGKSTGSEYWRFQPANL
jgi:hypothetical protein